MTIIFEPKVEKEDLYAIAVPAEGRILVPIKSCATLEKLKEEYKTGYDFAVERNITRPYPIEIIDGKGKILTDIINDYILSKTNY